MVGLADFLTGAGGKRFVGSSFEEAFFFFFLIQGGSGHLSASLQGWQACCLNRSHFNFLFLVMQPALSLEGVAEEGITWLGSSSSFAANSDDLGQTLTPSRPSEKW